MKNLKRIKEAQKKLEKRGFVFDYRYDDRRVWKKGRQIAFIYSDGTVIVEKNASPAFSRKY